jgi:hypothetical protein
LGFDLKASSHFHVIEYIQEQFDRCRGVDIYPSKIVAWICKESKWGRNTSMTIEKSDRRLLETMYLNDCLLIMGYSWGCQILPVDMEGETWWKIPYLCGSTGSIHQAQGHLCVCIVCGRDMPKHNI